MNAMRRLRWIVCVLVLLAGSWAALRVALWRPLPVVPGLWRQVGTHASGVIHVHTSESDGRRPVDEIVRAADAAGLDYVIITDHNTFATKPLERYVGNVLVIVGIEISTRCGHILAFGLPEPTFRFSDDPLEVLEDVHEFGGVAFLAHPDSPRDDLRWTCSGVPGEYGLEVVNGDSQWRQAGWAEMVRGVSTYAFNPTYALLRMLSRPSETLAGWNRLLAGRNVPVIAGADAHGFPSYEALFMLAQNHVLLEHPLRRDARADAAAIVASLGRGRAWVGLDALGPAEGFFFLAEAAGRQWVMGDEVPLVPAPDLQAGGNLPQGARLALLRNGHVIAEREGHLEWPDATAGVYRVEVYLREWDVPWIVSNSIYIFDSAAHEARRQRQLLPTTAVSVSRRVLDDFEGETYFEPAADASTAVASPMLEPGAGPDGSAAARLQFTLGRPAAETPSPFAALARPVAEDLSDSEGLVFSLRGDGIYRLWVQLRNENPRSEGGTEWWQVSVKTSTEWRRVAIPFHRFRTRDQQSDGKLDLDTTGIYFIVDTGVARPGTQGTIWLDGIGLY
jgi:hypothetical protein